MKLVNYFKSLADETRLRLLNLLVNHELNVNEIVSLMGMGQSRISRHLKILTESGLLTYRRDGLWVFYSAVKEGQGRDFIKSLINFIQNDPDLKTDLARLERMLEEGAKERIRYFDSIASNWDLIKGDIIGGLDIKKEISSRFDTCDVAADLGCGTGDLLSHLKLKADKVIGVDKSPKMLDEARRRLLDNQKGIDLRIGEIEHLPMRDSEADVAVLNMVIHYLPSPYDSLIETGRVLKKGGILIIVDIDKHQNEEMRNKYGHRWLGFTKNEIEGWLNDAGLMIEEISQFDIEKGLKINLIKSIKH